MGLSNAWNVATTSLATNAGLTSIVSRNIANAQNSTGYVSAKVAHLVTGSSGSAVIQSIADLTNASLFNSMLSSTSAKAAAQALSNGVAQLQQTVSDATSTSDSTTAAASPSSLLQSLATALQTYSSSPGSTSAASAVFSAAQNLTQGLNAASATVQTVRETADQDMVASVATVKSLLSQFQQVNTAIVNGTATGADVTDALDQRNTVLQSLSQQIGVTTATASNNSMSIYTDSGVTLFDTIPRSVTMAANTTYTASTTGAAVTIDGVPVTGANAIMPIQSGALAGLANLRDTVATQYQSQLDSIAGGLIKDFAEAGSVPGLFITTTNSTSLPSSTSGLASEITVSAVGGDLTSIRDGTINSATSQNPTPLTPSAGFNTVINSYMTKLATQTFPSGSGLASPNTVTGQAADSASWLDAQYQSASNNATYQTTLSSQASQALSNATGVNIDQQMSRMLDLENSYQASAKLISTINSMFNSLLQAVA